MHDVYYVPWCRAGPYFIGVLLGFFLFRVNGKLRIHSVSKSLFYVNMQVSYWLCQSEILMIVGILLGCLIRSAVLLIL